MAISQSAARRHESAPRRHPSVCNVLRTGTQQTQLLPCLSSDHQTQFHKPPPPPPAPDDNVPSHANTAKDEADMADVMQLLFGKCCVCIARKTSPMSHMSA